ncbi:hypothetical protein [Sinobaca sp. H24]|nr:hypothetical protein [Sinobaca sp. H24]
MLATCQVDEKQLWDELMAFRQIGRAKAELQDWRCQTKIWKREAA